MRIGAGRCRGRALPRAHEARPVPGRLRTSLFSVLAPLLEGARVLDLCAGVGALGLEALSRGARHVVLVDRDPRAVAALLRWIDEADLGGEAEVLEADVLAGPLPQGPFGIVFADPPFALWEEGLGPRLLGRAAERLGPGGVVAAKVPRGLSVEAPAGLAVLRRVEQGRVGYLLLGREAEGASRVKSPDATAD